MPISNSCVIELKAQGKTVSGKMVNISAGGFAIESMAKEIADSKGEDICIRIENFALLAGQQLDGQIIRVTDNSGRYIIGCRMFEDSKKINNYVEENYSGD